MKNTIIINNCNNIDSGEIQIVSNTLNIKYGINGTGKSTIANTISCYLEDKINGTNSLTNLKPFKHRNTNQNNPRIDMSKNINSILTFNPEYIEKYVFQEDELIKNSFNILICDETYNKNQNNLDDLIEELKAFFTNNDKLEKMILNLENLQNAFGNAQGLSKSSKFYKALSKGNRISNIPTFLKPYKDFIKSDLNVKWAKWHLDGSSFLPISSNCPFCSSDTTENKDKILEVKDTYNHNNIKHLNDIISIVEELNQFFSTTTYNKILELCNKPSDLDQIEGNYIIEVRDQLQTFLIKLNNLKHIEFDALKHIEKQEQLKIQLENHKINLELLSHLKSDSNKLEVESLNEKLDSIVSKSSRIFGQIRLQKIHIKNLIQKNNEQINYFLKSAGYNYHVTIDEDPENHDYKLKLKHNDLIDNAISNSKHHLSFGETNAFALVLFMLEALNKNPDLIILDDPISSFDEHKKYAIIDMLFRADNSLKGKTVLLLTHDFEPVIDMIHVFDRSIRPQPNAVFLENNLGVLIEKIIEKSDIQSFMDIANENIGQLSHNDDNNIRKIIYLRRLYEINNDKNEEYQILSNLFKKRDVLIDNDDIQISTEIITNATIEIQKHISDFDYFLYLTKFKDTNLMFETYKNIESNYEKLQIYRILNVDNSSDRVIKKFVNEAYHIENDYLYQLNPCKYQTVPSYIIEHCNDELEELVIEATNE